MQIAKDDPEKAARLSGTDELDSVMANAPAWISHDYAAHDASDDQLPAGWVSAWVKSWPYGSEGVKPVVTALFGCLRAAVSGNERRFTTALTQTMVALFAWYDDLFGRNDGHERESLLPRLP